MTIPDNGMNDSQAAKLLALILVGVLAMRAVLLLLNAVPFNGDEAIVALMGRHILQGERPWFFYGQEYMGSLDAYLLAGSFFLLGQSVSAIRVAQTLLFVGMLLSSYLVALRITRDRRVGVLTTLLLAFPPVLLTLYTTATLGGYGETLLIGNLLVWLAHRLGHEDRRTWSLWLAWGLLAGVGFWSMALVMVYAVPAALWLLWKLVDGSRERNTSNLVPTVSRLTLMGVGFGVGILPWCMGGGANDILRLLGTESHQSATIGAFAINVGERLFRFVAFGLPVLFGLRFPWSVDGPPRWLAVPVLALYLGAIGFAVSRWQKRPDRGHLMLWGMCALLSLGFVLTPYGSDPSGRYFLPLFLPLAVFTAQAVEELQMRVGRWAWVLVGLVLTFNLVGTVQAALANPPGITTQFTQDSQVDHRTYDELIQFLREHGETRGYTNYWVAYPVAFLSGEEIILVPRLPYKTDLRYTPRDDRYAPYRESVEVSPTAVYVTTSHPRLDALLRSQLTELGVGYKEEQIRSYRIFYDLSRKVTPQELSLKSGE